MIYKFIFETDFVHLNEYINAERTNRFKASSIKKEMTDSVVNELMQYGTGKKKPILDKCYVVSFTWILKNARKDPDNVSFAQKFILDGFVKNGNLPNDNIKYIKALEHNFIIDKNEKYTTCIVEFIETD